MATNLRLHPQTEKALRDASERTGRSQQELIRRALDEYLGLAPAQHGTLDELIAAGVASAPRPIRKVARLTLPSGATTERLLEREERF